MNISYSLVLYLIRYIECQFFNKLCSDVKYYLYTDNLFVVIVQWYKQII